MTSAASGIHRGQRRLFTEGVPGQLARFDAEASSLGLTWSAWVRALQEESVSMPEVIVFGVRAVGTDQIRFVGRTARTLEQRRREGFTGKLGEWCATGEWELFELERTTVSASAEAEARWVAELGADGLLFNPRAGAAGAVTGEVRFAVGLPRATHAAALELACAGHWSLGAFVQLAVEKLIERMKAGESVEVRAPGAAKRLLIPAKRPLIPALPEGATAAEEVERLQTNEETRAYNATRRAAPVPAVRFERQPHAPIGSASNPRSAVGDSRSDADEELEEAPA